MTTSKTLMLLIFIISPVIVDPASSQLHHSLGISSSLDAQQWTQTWHHPVTSPAPVWIPETPPATDAPLSWTGGESTSAVIRTVRLAHVHRILTTTVSTSQVRLVTADRVHNGQMKTQRPVSSVPSVLNTRGTRASQPLTDVPRNHATKETVEGPASALDNTMATSGRTSSVNQLKTEVPSRQMPPIGNPGKQNSSVDSEDNTDDAVVNSSSSKFQASSDDITNSSIQGTSLTLPVRFGEDGVISDEAELVKDDHDPVSIEDDLRTGEVAVQVSESEDVLNSSGIFDGQNDVGHDPGDPLMVLTTTGDHTSLPTRPPGSGEVSEGSGNPTPDTAPVVDPAPIPWISEPFLALSEATHLRSRADGLSAVYDTQVPELSEDTNWTNKSEVEPLLGLDEKDVPFLTTAMPVDFDDTKPTTSRGNEIGNAIPSAEKYRTGSSTVPTTVLQLSTTPRSSNMLVNGVLPRNRVNDPDEMWKYVVSEEHKEPGSGDSDPMWPTVFQRSPVGIALSGSLPATVADSPVIISVTSVSNDTSTQPLPPADSSSRTSPDPYTDAPPESLSTIAAETADIRKTAAFEPNASRDTNAEDLAAGRSASSLDVSASSGGRPRWLWAVTVPVLLLLLTMLAVAVYWRLVRRRRRKLDISGGGGGIGAASPWSRPAQPVLHSSERPAFDADESLAPPPPSYREHLGVGATNAPSVSLELEEESPVSSLQTSGTDVSTESV